MLEKPNLDDDAIVAALGEHYALDVPVFTPGNVVDVAYASDDPRGSG